MNRWFRDQRLRKGEYVAIREYSSTSFPKPSPKLSQRARVVFWMGLTAVAVYFIVSGDLGLIRLFSLHDYHHQLVAEELSLTTQVVDLDTRFRLLETDTLFIEKIARTEYKLSRPDEIVYEVVPKSAPVAAKKTRSEPGRADGTTKHTQ